MNSRTIIAIVLIVIGAVALAYQGISYTTREKAIDLGPIEVTTTERHTLPLPPILGAAALLAGVVMLVLAGKKA